MKKNHLDIIVTYFDTHQTTHSIITSTLSSE